jgi:hypothetical protein
VGYYLGIYFALGIGSAALVVVQTLILWILCSIEVSFPMVLRLGLMQQRKLANTPGEGIQKAT